MPRFKKTVGAYEHRVAHRLPGPIQGIAEWRNKLIVTTKTGMHALVNTRWIQWAHNPCDDNQFGTAAVNPNETLFVRTNTEIFQWCQTCRALERVQEYRGVATDGFSYGPPGLPLIVNSKNGVVRIGRVREQRAARLVVDKPIDIAEGHKSIMVLTEAGIILRCSRENMDLAPFMQVRGARTITAAPGNFEQFLVGTSEGSLLLVRDNTAQMFWQGYNGGVPRVLVVGKTVYATCGNQVMQLSGGFFPCRVNTRSHAAKLTPTQRRAAMAVMMVARRKERQSSSRLWLPRELWRLVIDLAGTLGRPPSAVLMHSARQGDWQKVLPDEKLDHIVS